MSYSLSFLDFVAKARRIKGWLSIDEAYFLYQMAKSGPGKGRIVEIGSWMGKSTVFLAFGSKVAKREKVIAIDPHNGEYSGQKRKSKPTLEIFIKNLTLTGVKDWVIPYIKTSRLAAEHWKGKIRFLFIDGLHDYQHVLEDFRLWEPNVIDGGIIALHDAYHGYEGPEKVILEHVFPNSHFSKFGVVGSLVFFRKKKAIKINERTKRAKDRILMSFAKDLKKIPFPPLAEFIIFHKFFKLLLR